MMETETRCSGWVKHDGRYRCKHGFIGHPGTCWPTSVLAPYVIPMCCNEKMTAKAYPETGKPLQPIWADGS